MDPITQAALGAAAAQSVSRAPTIMVATVCGIVAGLAPDLDAFIRSDHDSLLYLEYHRQFTHSLLFIPFGALLCAGVMHGLLRRRQYAGPVFLFCCVAFATHGLLDACTSYGTQLLWPFSDRRVAWHVISIVDPLLTLPLLALVWVAVRRRESRWARLGLVWTCAIMLVGVVQRERAETAGTALAMSRAHAPQRLHAKPAFANQLVWKVIYEYDGRYYVDAVRPAIDVRWFRGQDIAVLDLPRHLPWLEPGSQQARDIERFRWFSDGYLAPDPVRNDFVIDMRYSMLPHAIDGLWGIRLDPNAQDDKHAVFESDRRPPAGTWRRLWQLLRGQGSRPLGSR